MKKIFFFLLLIGLTNSQSTISASAIHKTEFAKSESYVYICNGPKSKRYHSTSQCKGLSSCSTEIEKVTLSVAKEKGRTACQLCE